MRGQENEKEKAVLLNDEEDVVVYDDERLIAQLCVCWLGLNLNALRRTIVSSAKAHRVRTEPKRPRRGAIHLSCRSLALAQLGTLEVHQP